MHYTDAGAYETAMNLVDAGYVVFCVPHECGVKVVYGSTTRSHLPYVMNANPTVRAAYLLSAGTEMEREFDRRCAEEPDEWED